jgi:protein-S-isoprenylcysteine O-methyltransferase Ste14
MIRPPAPSWFGGALPLAIVPPILVPRDGPALVALAVVAAYWWRVVRMAAKMRRRTGRAANFVPGEPLGRVLRFVWLPVVSAWIAIPLYLVFAARPPAVLRPVYRQDVVQWLAVAVVAAAYGATRVCWRRMGKSWRMGIDPGERTALVLTGPYAHVRHPIYALSSLMMLGTLTAVPSPVLAGVAVAHILLLQWEARREERHLARVHGPAYDEYRVRVGRFVPRLRRRDRYAAAPSVS